MSKLVLDPDLLQRRTAVRTYLERVARDTLQPHTPHAELVYAIPVAVLDAFAREAADRDDAELTPAFALAFLRRTLPDHPPGPPDFSDVPEWDQAAYVAARSRATVALGQWHILAAVETDDERADRERREAADRAAWLLPGERAIDAALASVGRRASAAELAFLGREYAIDCAEDPVRWLRASGWPRLLAVKDLLGDLDPDGDRVEILAENSRRFGRRYGKR